MLREEWNQLNYHQQQRTRGQITELLTAELIGNFHPSCFAASHNANYNVRFLNCRPVDSRMKKFVAISIASSKTCSAVRKRHSKSTSFWNELLNRTIWKPLRKTSNRNPHHRNATTNSPRRIRAQLEKVVLNLCESNHRTSGHRANYGRSQFH